MLSKQGIPYKALLTDITYLFYGNAKKAYLSTIKDASSNEILAYHISDRITMEVATGPLSILTREPTIHIAVPFFRHIYLL
jgi:putative transposase